MVKLLPFAFSFFFKKDGNQFLALRFHDAAGDGEMVVDAG